ncbi:uncharacterized protein LOC124807855 isoform X2 [Hydra vulgaris]|uniref:Uncharacterized protein LOC124807855 isoform X2 n=1 Tax=Hydra vulgaris TaxID=6087 RepID=A0ABM4D3M4_HYDVU
MSSNSVISMKVYYTENKQTKEIRKFSVDKGDAKSYKIVTGKICNIFCDLSNKDFHLFWKNNKDGYILILTDDELELAHQSIENNCLKLYVIETQYLDIENNRDQYHCEIFKQGANEEQLKNKEALYERENASRREEQLKNEEALYKRNNASRREEQLKNEEVLYERENASSLEQDLSNQMIEKFTDLFGFHPSVLVSSSKNTFEKLQHEVKNIKFCSIDDIKGSLIEFSKYFDIQFAIKNVQTFFQQLTDNNIQDKNIDNINPLIDQLGLETKAEYNDNSFSTESPYRGDAECEQNAEYGQNTNFDHYTECVQAAKCIRNDEYGQNTECGKYPKCRDSQMQLNCDMAAEKDLFLNNVQPEGKFEKALYQMEAMGFDMEDEALRQLLIRNDCSIEKVFDAMNPL